MASIKKQKDKYVVIYDYQDENNKRKQKWKTFKIKSDALKFKIEVESNKINNNFINPSITTVREFFTEWLTFRAKSKWQYQTYHMSQSIVNTHIIPRFGDVEVQKLTPKEIEQFITDLRFTKNAKANNKSESEKPYLSSTTVRHIYMVLKSALDKAVEWKLISENPVLCEKPAKADTETEIWDTDEVKAALADIKHKQLHLAVHLAFVCSLRVGEAMGLTWDCVDFKNSSIKINKTMQRVTKTSVELMPKDKLYFVFPAKIKNSKSVLLLKSPKTSSSNRTLHLTKELKDELYERYQDVEKNKKNYKNEYENYNLVFSVDDGYPVDPKLCDNWFTKWHKKTTINVPKIIFHALRHSSTTYKLSLSGGDIKAVQGDTGHATADMVVNTYSHMQDKARTKMAELIEKDFYNESTNKDVVPENINVESLIKILNSNPDLKEKLLDKMNGMHDMQTLHEF